MISNMFTDTEERIMDLYKRRTRLEVISHIETALILVNDPDMIDECQNLLIKLKEMRDEFGALIRIVAQERFSMDEFKTVKLIGELEEEKYDASEREAHIEDLTVNYFYAMYVLSRCDSFIASGTANGVDIVNCFNNGAFAHYYLFTVGMNGLDPKTKIS